MAVSITFIGNGGWGTGSGVPLSRVQHDTNNYNIKTAIEALQASAAEGRGVTNIEVEGLTATVYYTDETTSTFTLPQSVNSPAIGAEIVPTSGEFVPMLADANFYFRHDDAADVTFIVPAEADVNFDVDTEFHLRQVSTGSITVEGDTGVTLNPAYGCTNETIGPGATVTVKKVASDEWDVIGGQLVAAP